MSLLQLPRALFRSFCWLMDWARRLLLRDDTHLQWMPRRQSGSCCKAMSIHLLCNPRDSRFLRDPLKPWSNWLRFPNKSAQPSSSRFAPLRYYQLSTSKWILRCCFLVFLPSLQIAKMLLASSNWRISVLSFWPSFRIEALELSCKCRILSSDRGLRNKEFFELLEIKTWWANIAINL